MDLSSALPPWGDKFTGTRSVLEHQWVSYFMCTIAHDDISFCCQWEPRHSPQRQRTTQWIQYGMKILMGLWFLVHTSNMGYFISDCFVSDCLCEGLCGQLTWSEMIKSRSLVYKKLDHFVSGFHDIWIWKKYTNIYIKSSDQALDSFKEKGIHWILKLGNLCYIGWLLYWS